MMKRLILLFALVPAIAFAGIPKGLSESCAKTYPSAQLDTYVQSFNRMWTGANKEICIVEDPCQNDSKCVRLREKMYAEGPTLVVRPCGAGEFCPKGSISEYKYD